MINSRAVPGAIKQMWMPAPQPVSFELRVDVAADTLAIELPTGTKIALSYSALREMVRALDARGADGTPS